MSKVDALKRTTELVEHREGGDPSTSRNSPRPTKYGAIKLERDLRAGGGCIPPELARNLPIEGVLRAENCGIFGGNRLDFIHHVAETAKALG